MRRVMLAYVLVFVLSGCQAQRQERPAEPKTQPVAVPRAQTKQEASLAGATPANASETEVRALRRYNENAWFIQQAMRVRPARRNSHWRDPNASESRTSGLGQFQRFTPANSWGRGCFQVATLG